MVSEYNFSGTLDFGVRDLDNEKSQITLGRMAWHNSAKGLGIILVVTFHAVGGSLQAGLIASSIMRST